MALTGASEVLWKRALYKMMQSIIRPNHMPVLKESLVDMCSTYGWLAEQLAYCGSLSCGSLS